MTPSAPRYSRAIAGLHWLSALLIFLALALGLSMVELPFSPTKIRWYSWHKWLGVSVFLLTALRLACRIVQGAPAPVAMPPLQRRLASVVHILLYLLMFILPLSGWLHSSAAGIPVVYLGIFPLPDLVAKDKTLAGFLEEVHEVLAYGLIGLLLAHVGAALKHHFLDRDGLIARMNPWPTR